jgi:PAS domain S-box-containing protein
MHLTILCLIILLPLLVFQGMEIRAKYRILYDHEVQANLEIARATRAMFGSYVNNLLHVEAALVVGFSRKELINEEISRAFKDFEDQSGIVSNLNWLSPQGRVLASSLPNAIGVDISERPHVIAIMNGQDWYISDLFVGKASGKPSFSVLKAVRDGAGNLRGILTAAIGVDRLQSEFSFQRSKSAALSIVDRNGMVVFRSPPLDLSWEQRNWLKDYPFFREALEGREYTGTVKGIDKERIIALVPMPFGWVAGSGRLEDDVVGTAFSQIQGSLVAFGSILLVALIAVAVMSKQITSAVRALQARSDAVSRGEYIAKDRLAGTKEFQILSNALDTMSEKVRSREESLRESEQRFRLAQQASRIGSFDWNIQTGVNVWTPELEIMYGLQPGEFGKTQPSWEQLVHLEDRPNALRLVERAFKTGEPVEGEWRVVWREDSVHWIVGRFQVFKDEAERPLRMIGVNMDITDRKQVEELSRQRLMEIEDLYHNTPVGMCVLDRDLRFLRINERLAEINGIPAADHIGKTVRDLMPKLADAVEPEMRCILETGEPKLDIEIVSETPAHPGVKRTWTEQWLPIKDSQGQVIGLSIVVEEITARKRAEEELRHLNENLEQLVQERTEKLRRLASELTLVEQRERRKLSTILHDGLQQYLVAAKMQLNGLMPEVAEERLKQSISDIEQLLGDAVQVSRSLAAELSPPILRDAGILAGLEWLSRWMLEKHHLKVQLVMEMDAPPLEEDVKVLLFESVREMLLNTVKHSNSRSAKIHLFQSNDHLGLTVSDAGKGFAPGSSNDGCSKTGFGLFSIQERLSVIGGTFKIDSAPGAGCRITLTAPLGQSKLLDSAQTASAETQPLPSPAAAGALGKVRILIVDDHIVMREGLARLLAQEPDFDVIGQATNGQQAIERVALLQPALILMDISMPVLDGIEATKVIHQQHPHIHIIGLSLYTEDERAREMLSAGASFYLSKSSPPGELKAAIRSCCGGIGPIVEQSKTRAGN